jgi:hypothetical protein
MGGTEVTIELKVRWKEPVQLDDIDVSTNLLKDELQALEVWPFVIFRAPAGFGKTYNVLVDAKKKGYDAYVQECSGDMGFYDLIGAPIQDGQGGAVYQAGQVASAVHRAQEGHKTVLIMDEINLLPANVLKDIGSVLDFRHWVDTPIGRLYGNKHLMVVGTANSEMESAGFELDVALQSRAVIFTMAPKDMASRMKEAKFVDNSGERLVGDTGGLYSLREIQQVQALVPVYGKKRAMKIIVNKWTDPEKIKKLTNAISVIYGKDKAAEML